MILIRVLAEALCLIPRRAGMVAGVASGSAEGENHDEKKQSQTECRLCRFTHGEPPVLHV